MEVARITDLCLKTISMIFNNFQQFPRPGLIPNNANSEKSDTELHKL